MITGCMNKEKNPLKNEIFVAPHKRAERDRKREKQESRPSVKRVNE
jgi:hypothetical protein